MELVDQIKQLAKRIESLKETIQTEEATKMSLVVPFFQMLGYDVFNPQEFVPEYTADVGIKKGEKVDYAIIKDGKPAILVECKSVTEKLDNHSSQLFRYFGTTEAKFGILTNGIVYRFYTDLENQNKMDKDPFLTINILSIRESQVTELAKFSKSEFDVESIFSSASELKYMQEFKTRFSEELANPSDDFTRLFLQGCYTGQKTQAVIDKFRPILQNALNESISEMMNDKIKTALGGSGGTVTVSKEPTPITSTKEEQSIEDESSESKIITTEEEKEAYFIVKNMLADVVDVHDISYKDTQSYIKIIYKNRVTKSICRFKLTPNVKVMFYPNPDKSETRVDLKDIYDIRGYKEQLIEVVKRYL